jgi:steroid delta-isomerase-like uncharacterized protein
VQGWKQAFPDATGAIRNVVSSGNTVVQEITWTGTHTGPFLGHEPSGHAFRIPAVSVYALDGLLFNRETVYYDSASLFRQLGLPLEGA